MTHQIMIEKNVPLPHFSSSYPFSELEIGDSFFVEMTHKQFNNAVVYARIKLPTKKFVCRTAEGGCRVWRIL